MPQPHLPKKGENCQCDVQYLPDKEFQYFTVWAKAPRLKEVGIKSSVIGFVELVDMVHQAGTVVVKLYLNDYITHYHQGPPDEEGAQPGDEHEKDVYPEHSSLADDVGGVFFHSYKNSLQLKFQSFEVVGFFLFVLSFGEDALSLPFYDEACEGHIAGFGTPGGEDVVDLVFGDVEAIEEAHQEVDAVFEHIGYFVGHELKEFLFGEGLVADVESEIAGDQGSGLYGQLIVHLPEYEVFLQNKIVGHRHQYGHDHPRIKIMNADIFRNQKHAKSIQQ